MIVLGWLSAYILLVGLGIDGVAREMGIEDARAFQCFQIFAVIHAAHLIVALSARRSLHNWHIFGLYAGLTAIWLPWAVWLGWRLPPPMALLVVLVTASARILVPALIQRVRR